MKYILIVLMLIPFIGLGQQIKERIGWKKYAYHVTGDVYEVKLVTTYNKQGNWLKTYINKENNIDEEQRFDKQGRLVYKRINGEHGEPLTLEYYKYYDNKNYYKKFENGLDEKYLTYHYTNAAGQVVEEKVFAIDCSGKYAKKDDYPCDDERKWNLIGPIHQWIIKSYNADGLLLGERYKNAKIGELSKVIYVYKEGTNLVETVRHYYLDKNKKEVEKTTHNISYKYDEQNRLIYKKDQEDIDTYKYKNGKIWMKVSIMNNATCKAEYIYKDGLLVADRFYWTGSGRDLNGVKDLMEEVYYEYKYYEVIQK